MSKEKEIIIDGVDVSKCKYYSKKQQIYQATRPLCIMKDCCMLSNSTKPCTNNDCYFKQLRRLQDENKRLQMLSCANCGEKYLSPDGAELYEKNVQLQKENEELKKKKEEILKNGRILSKLCSKYRQALEEIRKWATNHNPCDIEADINCTKEDCFKCLNYDTTKITKIINEVLNARD